MSNHQITIEGNSNYAAMVVAYDPANVVELPNRDRVVGYKVLGYQSIIGKDSYKQGELLVVFGAETQLSEAYASVNNLHRHEHLNSDPTAKGYLDDNRRVRAIRLGGHRSDALVMPLSSIDWAIDGDFDYTALQAGVAFDTLDGVEICRKYIIQQKPQTVKQQIEGRRKVRVTTESFPEHYDTPNGHRFGDRIFYPTDYVTVTQKLHGTSFRLANVPVLRDLTWLERLAVKLGVKVKTHEYGVVAGSRRVTKSIDGQTESGKQHFYANDIWTQATEFMHDLLPENFVVFGEIVGWTDEATPIQPKYTYDVPRGRQDIYVYRVATVNGQGDLVDLPWRAVQRFCEARGWKTPPVLWDGFYRDFEPDAWMDLRYTDHFIDAVPLSDPKTVDEGVVVRADTGFQPSVAKFKSPIFLGHETALMDKGEADVESAEEVG